MTNVLWALYGDVQSYTGSTYKKEDEWYIVHHIHEPSYTWLSNQTIIASMLRFT